MAQVDASSADARFDIGDAKNVVCAPIATSQGKVYAVIKFTNKLSNEARSIQFSKDDATIIQAIADSAGVALHKARLRGKVTSEQRKNKSLISVMKAVHQSKDNVDLLVNNLVSVAYDIIEVEFVNLFIADESSKSLICTVSKIEEIEGNRFPFGSADRQRSSVAGMVAYTGASFCLNDVSSDAEVLEEFKEMGVAAKNVLCMPIRDHRKKLVAIIELVNKNMNRPFNSHDEDVLAAFGDEVSSALKRVVLEKAFQHKSWNGEEEHIVGLIEQYSNKILKPRRSSQIATIPAGLITPKASARRDEARRGGSVLSPVGTKIRVSKGIAECPSPNLKDVNLKQLKAWDFDVLKYDNKELLIYAGDMLSFYNIAGDGGFGAGDAVLQRFLVAVSGGYRENSFHSFFHAMAVMHMSFLLLSEAGADSFLESRDACAVLIGAICHDLDHPGTTNDFQKASGSDLALLYNDRSILENHHAASAFKLMSKPELNILAALPREDFQAVRKLMIEIILGTDMANHFECIKQMQTLADNPNKTPETYFDIESESDRRELSCLIVHCADLSNPAYPLFDMTKQWCFRVCQEFSHQVEMERQNDLPVTPFMCGLTSECNIAKLQVGFVNYVINPLWKVTGLLLPLAAHLEANCVTNVKVWQRIIDNGESPVGLPLVDSGDEDDGGG